MGVVALDIGGTTLKGGVVGPDGPSAPVRVPTDRERGPDAVIETVLSVCDQLVREADAAHVPVDAVGIAVLGVVDEDGGVARWSASIGWRDVPLRDLVAERTGHQVALGHDVRAAALLEATHGAGRSCRTVLFVAIGTGLSMAVVHDGQVLSGDSWRAGEIGQLRAGTGSLEDVASGSGMATAGDVIARAASGDATATAALDAAVDALAAALAVAVTVIDPGIVVVGGGVSLSGESYLGHLRPALAAALGWREAPPVVPASFGDEAGWLGAALLAWRHSPTLTTRPFPGAR